MRRNDCTDLESIASNQVHASTLDDLVFPSEITGKRTRQNVDGSKVMKVFLDPKGECSGLDSPRRGLLD
jgi:hypothetical protein